MLQGIGRVVVLAGLTSAATSCALNPATGKRHLSLIPESQEIAMGKQAAEEVDATMGLVKSPELQAYVARLGKELAAKSERPDLPFTFKVVDDPVVNAFALPGGPIYVTRGLLYHMGSEAQLAAVMGHEIGHVTGRHAVRQISKASLAQLGFVVAASVSETVAGLGQLGLGGLQLLFLSYGRDAEREADDFGYRYAGKAGYDLREMPGVFATLKRVGEAGGGQRLPDWLSSHPSPDERIERIGKLIKEQNPPPGKVNRDELLALSNGLVYGADPRHGFFEGGVFKHPEMKFQIKMPQGWKSVNLAAAVLAQREDGSGMQLTLTQAASPAEAMQKFRSNQAVANAQTVDLPLTSPGQALRFSAASEDNPNQEAVRGLVVFISHGGKTFQLLGLAKPENFAGNEQTFAATAASFSPLTDPAALSVQPAKVKVISLPQAMTVAELAAKYPGLPPEKLAVLNQVEVGTRLEAGRKVKVVEGTVRPDSVAMGN